MTPENDKKLCESFPLLYADRHASMQSTCMCWGFECGDGWFDLIYKLSEKLERIIEKLPEEEKKWCRASQVKEKYGTLRFYMYGSNEEMDEAINEAEGESARTCEDCGQSGKRRGGGWIQTLCDECWNLTSGLEI